MLILESINIEAQPLCKEESNRLYGTQVDTIHTEEDIVTVYSGDNNQATRSTVNKKNEKKKKKSSGRSTMFHVTTAATTTKSEKNCNCPNKSPH